MRGDELDDLRAEIALEHLRAQGRSTLAMSFSDLLGVYARLEQDYWTASTEGHEALGRTIAADIYPSHTRGIRHG